VIQRSADGFTARQEPAKLERHIEMRSGEIRSSLFAATDAAQVPDAIAMQIVEIFSSDIDFASDLRRGDRFQVIFETLWQGGEPLHSGRVLAVEFLNDGKTHQAIWFNEAGAEQGGYFDAEGKALKKEFLKSPLQFSRVTSGFTMRVHPISGMWKQHKGIDFAAPVGTPIRATGDGHVDFTGPHGGYGNMVVVKHSGSYSTAYAHMSHIASGLKRGARVAQGDVIGYVGTSGWSTGPHLHYEFRVNNDARDPKSIAAQQVQSLAGMHLQQFQHQLTDVKHRFRLLSADVTQVASR
jgi:murein DD-endopeptidase MepM/ murein hydrolase activator NlpD